MPLNLAIRILTTFTLLIITSGCANISFANSKERIEKQVEITGLSFDQNIKYTGPTIRSAGKRSSPDDIQLARLYAVRSRTTDEVSYYVLANVIYPKGLRYYRRARFADSSWVRVKKLWFAEEKCMTSGCYKNYALRFPVKLEKLVSHAELEFRLESVMGKSNVFSIPRKHIEGFILATNKHSRFRHAKDSARP